MKTGLILMYALVENSEKNMRVALEYSCRTWRFGETAPRKQDVSSSAAAFLAPPFSDEEKGGKPALRIRCEGAYNLYCWILFAASLKKLLI